MLSDGWTSTRGRCFHNGRYYNFSQCYKDYNDQVRASKPEGTVQIDAVSLRNDFVLEVGWDNSLQIIQELVNI